MIICSWRDVLDKNPQVRHGTVVVIGNFDGCHLGHQNLIARACDYASQHNLLSLALTFYPHPRVYFGSLHPHSFVFSHNSQKDRALKELGIDLHVSQKFDEDFVALGAEEFTREVLLKGLRASAVFVGKNFCFGKDRTGNASYLREYLQREQVYCEIVDSVRIHKECLSSSLVRRKMAEGDMHALKAALGRPLLYEGESVKGKGLGRELGFPTINLAVSEEYPLKNGVYTAFVSFDPQRNVLASDRAFWGEPAVINKGTRPTVDTQKHVYIEAHLLSPLKEHKEEYCGRNVGVYIMEYLRAEERFVDIDALKHKMSEDVTIAHARHKEYSR